MVPKLARVGQVMVGLVALFMVFDGVIHIMRIAAVVEAFAQLGYPMGTAVPMGLLELACVALLLVPRTRLVGAILLTGYLGGATAAQLRIGAPAFPQLFPALVGALLWAGLWLSDSRTRAIFRF